MKGKLSTSIIKSVFLSGLPSQNPLSEEVLSLKGMSGKRFRCFINHLLRELKNNISYLEVGVYTGSTSIAALYNNNIKDYILIDNWSQFGKVKDEFLSNFTSILKQQPNIISQDCFSVSLLQKNINVYFYDGDHSELSHYNALRHFYANLAQTFIFIVDDWSYNDVQNGTMRAISDLKLKVDYFWEHKYNSLCENKEEWWNGVGVFVMSK